MTHSVADVIKLDINQDLNLEDNDIVINDPGESTTGGASGGAEETGQLMGMIPAAPVQPLNAPKVNEIQYPPLEAVVREIGESLKERTKNINSVNYQQFNTQNQYCFKSGVRPHGDGSNRIYHPSKQHFDRYRRINVED